MRSKQIHEPTLTGMKTCVQCKRDLPAICFYASKEMADGLESRCRECNKRTPKRNKTKRKIAPFPFYR